MEPVSKSDLSAAQSVSFVLNVSVNINSDCTGSSQSVGVINTLQPSLAKSTKNNDSSKSADTLNEQSLKFASLNVCGLKRKILFPEFSSLINNYDVFSVCETKLDRYDLIELPGYVFFSQYRKQKYIRKSGGIGVFVKQSLSPHVSLIESDSDYVLWLSISKKVFNTDENIYVGAIYIPPNDSKFYNLDEIENFNIEITNMCVSNKYVLLMGDFNARTHNKQDFLEEDKFLMHHFNFDKEMISHYNVASILEQCNLSKERTSQDKINNNEGNKLIDICKSNNLFILNGRCGTDRNKGAMTFRNLSVIDYSIVSHHALQFVSMFDIIEVDPLFSDGHSLLSTNLCLSQNCIINKNTCLKQNNKRKPKLPEDKKAAFVQNINHSKVNDLHDFIQDSSKNSNLVNKDKINSMCLKFSEIFHESARSCIPDKSYSNHIKGKKPWFGKQCAYARKRYHLAKTKHSRNPSSTTRLNLVTASKAYKKKMNYFINKHNSQTQIKLRNLKNKSPKEYWKIINSVDSKKPDCNIELGTLFTFFKSINEQSDSENGQSENNINISLDDNDSILNSPITDREILKCIRSLKNNKACGNDDIINEYIKNTSNIMMPLYNSFFNLILETGILPDTWLEGIIRPIYKHKGDSSQPENYRPITILSCFGKLFTAVLNLRLNEFLNANDVLNENQAGFRAGYSTNDHIFVLHALIEILKSKKLKLFCSFIDFSKAFDSVWRVGLWSKLLANNINGKFFRIVYNMYQGIKSCISFNSNQSDFFQSFRGVRQGENLSPVLFALFLNDLECFLVSKNCPGIDVEFASDDVYFYLKLFVLLYADDTVIFGTDEESFQHSLSMFHEYSKLWRLDINYDKTKILIFGTRNDDRFDFRIGENKISICKEFKYLGVVFTKNRSFAKAIKHNYDQAKKAMHLLYKRIRHLNLPIDLQLQLFDHTILPIALYGCEVWAFEKVQLIENLQNEFLRYITNLRKSTPVYMLHAEFGRRPIDIVIKTRLIGFWMNIINGKESKLSKLLYNILFHEYCSGIYQHKWIHSIKEVLVSVGRIDLFNKGLIENTNFVKRQITETLVDLHIQDWHNKVNLSSKGKNYYLYKQNINLENYLIKLTKKQYSAILKYRLGNHRLPIETGRWENIPLDERKCNLCKKQDIGDEFHYLFTCDFFQTDRKQFLKSYFYKRPNVMKFNELLSTDNIKDLIQLSKFLDIILKKFSTVN